MARMAGILRIARGTRPTFGYAPMVASMRAFSSERFAKTHEWLRTSGSGEGVLGISDFAQNALGEVVYVDLPSVGATFKEKETVCTLESVKAVGEVYAPTALEVVEVNTKLSEEPALVNKSPEGDGWLVKVKYTGDLAGLMERAAYEKHLESEAKSE